MTTINVFVAKFARLPDSPPPVTLAELPPGGCKWLITDDLLGDGPDLFCGCPSETNRYCPTHEKMSGTRLPALVAL